jgi:hypothetical protein
MRPVKSHPWYIAGLLLAAGAIVSEAAPKPAENRNIPVTGQGFTMTLPDPKHPGWLLWKAAAATGVILPVGKAQHATLTDAKATMFQSGKAAATIVAPKVVGDTGPMLILASGGVRITSLLDKGSTLRADRVLWYARQNKVIADGHVVYRDGKYGMVFTGPRLVADTALRSVRSSSPGKLSLPHGF